MLIKRKRWFKMKSKYSYCIVPLVVDGTSGLFHTRQLTFILRSFIQEEIKEGKVNEKFLTLLDFEKIKTEATAHVILDFLHNTFVYKHLECSNVCKKNG